MGGPSNAKEYGGRKHGVASLQTNMTSLLLDSLGAEEMWEQKKFAPTSGKQHG